MRECKEIICKCILEKLITKKFIHKRSIQTALANICCNCVNLVVAELDHAVFKITIDKYEDYKRILRGR